jgi:hypothetical protein
MKSYFLLLLVICLACAITASAKGPYTMVRIENIGPCDRCLIPVAITNDRSLKDNRKGKLPGYGTPHYIFITSDKTQQLISDYMSLYVADKRDSLFKNCKGDTIGWYCYKVSFYSKKGLEYSHELFSRKANIAYYENMIDYLHKHHQGRRIRKYIRKYIIDSDALAI